MANTAHQNDSSMDDILMSIRNIISDDVKQSVGSVEKKTKPTVERKSPRAESISEATMPHSEQPVPSPARAPEANTRDETDVSLNITHEIPQSVHTEKSLAERIRSRIRAESSEVKTAPTMHADTYSRATPLPDALSEALGKEIGKELRESFVQESEEESAIDPETADYLDVDALRASLRKSVEYGRTSQVSPRNEQREYTQRANASRDSQQGALNVEQLVREVLQPLLSEWLESNLSNIVRGVVTENIEKMLASRHK